MENEELVKTQGQFEAEDLNSAELENIGETKEAAESAPGLEEMGKSANQDISQTLESAHVRIGEGIDLISRNEGTASEDVDEATAMGENISSQNEQDAQETRQEIKSTIDLAKESAQGRMTELEKKWAQESAKSDITTSEQKDDAIAVELPSLESVKSSSDIAKESSKGNISALEKKWAEEQAQSTVEKPQEEKVDSAATEAPSDALKQEEILAETADISDKELRSDSTE